MADAQCAGSPDALVGAGRWHADVGDDDVGLGFLDKGQELVIVGGRADQLEAGRGRDEPCQAIEQQDVVLGDRDTNRHVTILCGCRRRAAEFHS